MMTLVLTAVPAGLRGDLTKWLLEISPGVFVGHVSKRVREHLWSRVVAESREGRALLVYSTNTEQRLAFETHGHDWEPTDFDGLLLIRRPLEKSRPTRRTGWSIGRNVERAKAPSWARALHEDGKLSQDDEIGEQNA